MGVHELMERVVRWASDAPRDTRLARARTTFEQRTAPIESDQADYEWRIGHFLEWYACTYDADGEPPAVQQFDDAHPDLPSRERTTLAGMLRSQRALLSVEQMGEHTATLHDLLRGGRYCLEPSGRLRPGEIFDGRIVCDGPSLTLAPGRVFHPADTHASIRQLVADPAVQAMPQTHVLDALLAMRDRLQRFTRVRAEHLYTAEAIGSRAFSATWKRQDKTRGASEEAPRPKGP